jgi:hypothetical protein
MLNPLTLDLSDEDFTGAGAHCLGGPTAFHDGGREHSI